jgi:transcriptional regulator with XRE-family HTH domain
MTSRSYRGRRFARQLRRLRRAKNLSQKQVSSRSGIAQAQLSRYERGCQIPRRPTLRRLARILDVPPSQLFAAAGPQPPARPPRPAVALT